MMRLKPLGLGVLLLNLLFLSCSTPQKRIDGVSGATLNGTDMGEILYAENSRIAIVLYSSEESNTSKIGKEMAKVMGAHLLSPEAITPDSLSDYDLIGLGSGIFDQQHHESILRFATSLPKEERRKVFIISTSGVSRDIALRNDIEDPHDALRKILENRNCNIMGEFNCPGLNKNSFLILFGGMNKGRPNSKDLQEARIFAESLLILMGQRDSSKKPAPSRKPVLS